jgi:hypothetical protein
MSDDEFYLIWSNEHHGWWRIGPNGYSRDLADAGHYPRDQALAICRQAIITAAHIGMISELPARLADVTEFLEGQRVPEAIRRRGPPPRQVRRALGAITKGSPSRL